VNPNHALITELEKSFQKVGTSPTAVKEDQKSEGSNKEEEVIVVLLSLLESSTQPERFLTLRFDVALRMSIATSLLNDFWTRFPQRRMEFRSRSGKGL